MAAAAAVVVVVLVVIAGVITAAAAGGRGGMAAHCAGGFTQCPHDGLAATSLPTGLPRSVGACSRKRK